MSVEQKPKENSMMLALLLFLGATGLVFAYLQSEEPAPAVSKTPASVQSEKFEKSVNRHLMFTNEKMELERKRMQLENAQLMNADFNSTKPQEAYQNHNHLRQDVDTRSADIANELGRGDKIADMYSPHDVVQREIYDAQQDAEYRQAYREEYARQFIENARRGGYNVKLSEDLSRVISVQPISGAQKGMELFSGSGERIQ